MKHTAEPWRVDADSDGNEFFWIAAESETEIAMIADGRVDDARRIVACVNACEGISTSGVEAIAKLGGVKAKMAVAFALVCQRDELLAALEKIASPTQTTGLLWWQIEAREAIAKVGAGGTAIEGHNAQVERPCAASGARSARTTG